LGAFQIWKRNATIELPRIKKKTETGGQVGMGWSLTKMKFEMDEKEGLALMMESAFTRGVGAPANEIGTESVHHPPGIKGGGEESMEVFRTMHTNKEAEGGSNGIGQKMVLPELDYISTSQALA
jgi:hypothetical protein